MKTYLTIPYALPYLVWLCLSLTGISQESPLPRNDVDRSMQPLPDVFPKKLDISKLYFAEDLTITDGLYDPQNILTDDQKEIVRGLINEHDEKSQIPMNVFLFRKDQEIPLTRSKYKTRLAQLFASKNRLVVFYYYDQVLRSSGYLLLNEENNDFINEWEVDEMFLKTSRYASVQVDAFSQLENYINELSKRSFWIEQQIVRPSPEQIIKEEVIEAPHTKVQKGQTLVKFIDEHLLSVMGILAILIAAGWYYLWSSKWRKYVLPYKAMPTRLGAEYGANVCTPLEFSDTKVSLAEQLHNARNKDLEDI